MRPLEGDANFVQPAALLGDPTRARVLLALMDKRALPMSMLAAEAGVAQSTVSGHLTQLVDGGLLNVRREGRHRYFSIASEQVATAIEALSCLAPTIKPNSLRTGTRANRLRQARTCYDHMAGHLGVAVMGRLLDLDALEGGDGHYHADSSVDRLSAPGHEINYTVTPTGWRRLAEIDLTESATAATPRPLVRYCVDWTEQQHHLAGALGAALMRRFLDLTWVQRSRESRVLQVTPEGHDALYDWIGAQVGPTPAAARAA